MLFKNLEKNKLLEFIYSSKTFNELTLKIGYKGSVNPVIKKKIEEYYKSLGLNIKEILSKNKQINTKVYTCKLCNKVFTKKYSKSSSGKFCSRHCAAKYSANINRMKIKEKLSIYNKKRLEIVKQKYYNNPKLCPICNKIIDYEHKYNKTCSLDCSRKLAVKNNPHINDGGYRKGSSRGHSGNYKGIHCDSTYELAYVIYCLDHNINISRCNEVFEYKLNGKIHKYHPDFIVDGIIIEIKNYYRKENDIKLNAITKEKKILYYEDLIPCFKYVAKAYNKKFNNKRNNFYELYE